MHSAPPTSTPQQLSKILALQFKMCSLRWGANYFLCYPLSRSIIPMAVDHHQCYLSLFLYLPLSSKEAGELNTQLLLVCERTMFGGAIWRDMRCGGKRTEGCQPTFSSPFFSFVLLFYCLPIEKKNHFFLHNTKDFSPCKQTEGW